MTANDAGAIDEPEALQDPAERLREAALIVADVYNESPEDAVRREELRKAHVHLLGIAEAIRISGYDEEGSE